MSKRIRYSTAERVKKMKLPPMTKKIDRSTKYGNPFSIDEFGRDQALRLYEIYLDWVLKKKLLSLDELKDMDVACSCKPEENCHGDILLKRLNEITDKTK